VQNQHTLALHAVKHKVSGSGHGQPPLLTSHKPPKLGEVLQAINSVLDLSQNALLGCRIVLCKVGGDPFKIAQRLVE
jgi:hypothetical protein